MRMDGSWERNVGEVAIWRLTTHFTFRDFIPRTNKLLIYTTPIRLCNGQEKKCPREGKKCCIRVHELNWIEWNWVWARERATVRKPKKKWERETERTNAYEYIQMTANMTEHCGLKGYFTVCISRTNHNQKKTQTERQREGEHNERKYLWRCNVF